MKFIKWFYEALGNSKEQRFTRLMIIIITIGLFTVSIINIGYEDGKFYWKPANISYSGGKK